MLPGSASTSPARIVFIRGRGYVRDDFSGRVAGYAVYGETTGERGDRIPGVREELRCLRQSRIFRPCFLEKPNVRVGGLPQRQEILVDALRLHRVPQERERTSQSQARHRVHGIDRGTGKFPGSPRRPVHRTPEIGHAFFVSQVLDVGHEPDAVAGRVAQQGDQADNRSDEEHAAGHEHPGGPADEGQRQVHQGWPR